MAGAEEGIFKSGGANQLTRKIFYVKSYKGLLKLGGGLQIPSLPFPPPMLYGVSIDTPARGVSMVLVNAN